MNDERNAPVRLRPLGPGMGSAVLCIGLFVLTFLSIRYPQMGLLLGGIIIAGFVAYLFQVSSVIAVLGFWTFLVVQQPLATVAGGSTAAAEFILRADDAAAAVLLVAAFVRRRTRLAPGALSSMDTLVTVGALCFIGAGIASTLVNSTPLVTSAVGGWLACKLLVGIYVTRSVDWASVSPRKVLAWFVIVGVPVAVLGFVDRFDGGQLRQLLGTSEVFTIDFRNATAVKSIFPNPGRFSFFMAALFAVALGWALLSRSRVLFGSALLFAAGALLSLRLKGLAGLALTPLLLLLLSRSVSSGKRLAGLVGTALACIAAAPLLAGVIGTQVSIYSGDVYGETPRSMLYRVGARIAVDEFPLGAGVGRFGSFASVLDYSPVYHRYGLSGIYGFTREQPYFLTDTSWPTLLGETGVLGALGFLLVIIGIGRSIRRAALVPGPKEDGRYAPIAAALLGVILLDALASQAFFDATAVYTVLIPIALLTAAGSPAPLRGSSKLRNTTRLAQTR